MYVFISHILSHNYLGLTRSLTFNRCDGSAPIPRRVNPQRGVCVGAQFPAGASIAGIVKFYESRCMGRATGRGKAYIVYYIYTYDILLY